MTEKEISKDKVIELIKMKKFKNNGKKYSYPEKRGKISVPLQLEDKKENFFFDVNRNGISLEKVTYQNRSRKVIILARIDFGAPHRNPDGEKVSSIYTPRVVLYGKAGFNHTFDFVIPKSVKINKPERIIKVINEVSESNIKSFLFSCTDIKNMRGGESKFYPIINDAVNDNISSKISDAVGNYDMTILNWSDRENFKHELRI